MWAGHAARVEARRSASEILRGTATGNRPLGKSRLRRRDYIWNHLKGIGINTTNWVFSAHDRNYWRVHENAVLNLQVPQVMRLVTFLLSIVRYRSSIIMIERSHI